MKKLNTGFMCKCGLCGNKRLALSELILKIGYGSDYDGEILSVAVCGSCADRIYDEIFNRNRTF